MGAAVATALCALTFSAPGAAHVTLDSPKSGMTLAVGSTVVITWEDTILHDGIGYDLDLVDVGARAQSPIVHDLPTTQHRYDWLVPNVLCVGCYVVVAQVNVDHDYFDSALVNIYGKPATAGGSGGMGVAPGGGQGGTTGTPDGGGGGTPVSQPPSGSGGTLPVPPSGSAGRTESLDLGAAGSVDEGSASASGAAPAQPMSSPIVPVSGAGGDAGSADADAPIESAPDPALGSSHSEGCSIDRRAPSQLGLVFVVFALLVSLATRKRRAARWARLRS